MSEVEKSNSNIFYKTSKLYLCEKKSHETDLWVTLELIRVNLSKRIIKSTELISNIFENRNCNEKMTLIFPIYGNNKDLTVITQSTKSVMFTSSL